MRRRRGMGTRDAREVYLGIRRRPTRGRSRKPPVRPAFSCHSCDMRGQSLNEMATSLPEGNTRSHRCFGTRLFSRQINSSAIARCEHLFHSLQSLARSTRRSCLSLVYRLREAHYVPRICEKSGHHVILAVRYLQGEPETGSAFHVHCEWTEAIRM